MSLATELKFFGAQPQGAQSVPNSALVNMPARSVKANPTNVAASPQDVVGAANQFLQVNAAANALGWVTLSGDVAAASGVVSVTTNDTTTLLGVQGLVNPATAFWNPLYFGNPGTGRVHRFNRVKVGIACLSSSDVPQTTPDWLEALGFGFAGFSSGSSLVAISSVAGNAIVGASRTSDFALWLGLGAHSGGSQGGTFWGLNDDLTGGTPIAVGINPIAIRAPNIVNTVAITIASPAVFTTPTNHGYSVGQALYFTTTGALPTGLTAGYPNFYYIITAGFSPTTFQVSLTQGGAAVNTSGAQSGVHTATATCNGITLNQFDASNAADVVDIFPFAGVVSRTVFAGAFTPGANKQFSFSNISAAFYVGGGGTQANTVTITIASPAVITLVNHSFGNGTPVVFTTTGSLPTGIVSGTTYYVLGANITTNTFQIAAAPNGTPINTSGSQSGTQTVTFTFARHRKGGVFLNAALDTAVGAGTNGVALEFARGMSLRWMNSTPTVDAEIWAAAGGVAMSANGVATTPLNAAGSFFLTLNQVSGSGWSLQQNGAEVGRGQVLSNTFQIGGIGGSVVTEICGNTFGVIGIAVYPSGGVFHGNTGLADPGVNNTTIAGVLRINQAPTVVTHTVGITAAADSVTNFGHVLTLNMNGTVYYIPCGSVQP